MKEQVRIGETQKDTKRMHIVLVQPEIAGNTGNVARLCAATGCALHLVRPLGFHVDDRHLKRAGLDYWHLLPIFYYDNFAEVQEKFSLGRMYFCSTKAEHSYSSVSFQVGDVLVFGRETAGLAPEILSLYPEHNIRIPMRSQARSLNLANSVAIVTYEALRQNAFLLEDEHG